jgi:hypothetical protein
MEPSQELVNTLFWRRVEAARSMTPGDRLTAGIQLFDLAVEMMGDGIRHEHPEFSDEQVTGEVRRLLEVAKRLEEYSE